jgi:hypothetical protein
MVLTRLHSRIYSEDQVFLNSSYEEFGFKNQSEFLRAILKACRGVDKSYLRFFLGVGSFGTRLNIRVVKK